jgi:ketosteroid isomerase-like protein
MRTLLTYSLASLLIWGCAANEDNPNTAVAEKLFEAFNRHDWQQMASYYSDSARFLDPSFGKEYVIKSRNETAKKYADMESMFADLHDDVVAIHPAGDVVTVEFVATGSVNDSIKFRLPIVSVLTFRDGMIIKDATYYDLENP